jgi:hypothetical protein
LFIRYTYLETGDPARLPAKLAGDRDKGIEIVYGEENFFFTGPTREATRQNKKLLYRHDKPNEPIKEGPLSFVLFESLFTSVSKVSRGHPSLMFIVSPRWRHRLLTASEVN